MIIGYAAVFGCRSCTAREHGREFKETILPGAFARVLAGRPDVPMNVNHEGGRILGRTRDGSLRLWEDSRGLAFALETSYYRFGDLALELVRGRTLWGASFMYRPGSIRWRGNTREIQSVSTLADVCLCSRPCCEHTAVSLIRRDARPEHVERILRLIHAEANLTSIHS